MLARPGLRSRLRTRRGLRHVLTWRLIRAIHALAGAVLHAAHARELHAGLHLAGTSLAQVRGRRLRGMLCLRLRGVAAVAGLWSLGALRPHGLAWLLVAVASRSGVDGAGGAYRGCWFADAQLGCHRQKGHTSDGSLAERALRIDGLRVGSRGHHHLRALRGNNSGLGDAGGGGVRRVRRSAGGNSRVGRAGDGLREGRLGGLLVWPAPDALKVVVAHLALLIHGSVEVGGVVGLRVKFHQRGRPGLVLIRGSGDLLSGPALDNAAVVPGSVVTEVWSDC